MVQNMFTSGLRHLFVICAKFLLREVYMTQFMGYGAECACVLTEQWRHPAWSRVKRLVFFIICSRW